VVDQPKALEGGKCALVVPDDLLEGQAAVVVLVDANGTILAQRHTTIAGEED
jgi:hypothetical protein